MCQQFAITDIIVSREIVDSYFESSLASLILFIVSNDDWCFIELSIIPEIYCLFFDF